MTRPTHTLLLLALAFGCADEKNALDIDDDGDGVTEFEGDCDDADPDTYPGAAKSDSTTACMTDLDGDGWGAATVSGDVKAGTDCDDGDSAIQTITDDADCDGVVSSGDCGDDDTALGAQAEDGDCDGVLTVDDCDDGDASKPNDDMDCDGVLTSDDCDDGDANTIYDIDCDGVLTLDDCDDGDASSTVVVDDGDCDGVLTADDCNDGDDSLGAVDEDGDCDGVLTSDDCDDGDADSTTVDTDRDCDGREDYVADHGGTMILIDAQTFEMGCTAGMSGCYADESPAHFVTLTNDFYIGETEVTQGEYEAMMGTNPSYFSGCGSDCPVEKVSWNMSAAFANAVSDSEGLEQCYTCTGSGTSTDCSIAVEPYSCGGYRLPTEAEWEAAARCGEDTLYAGSTVIGDVAWYLSISASTTHTVATKASNACGLYDMSGNLWEWTQDWYTSSYYSSSPGTDPGGPTSGDGHIVRGGSWSSDPFNTRVARRYNATFLYYSGYGIRLLRTSP